MAFSQNHKTASRRWIWLRRFNPQDPAAYGAQRNLELSVIGNAAARETFVTATPHMAAIWTDLFQSMITQDYELRWRDNGPGIGRDARIAYSSLLGRYMARAYLTEHEGVRALVPLDEAKRRLEGTPYVIEKDPPGRGFEADWIGVDDYGLVIVEAKGTFDNGIKPWHGPYSRPQILKTAIAQARRTAVFVRRGRLKLPAKRWAIASRWGTEENYSKPTLLAWASDEGGLGEHHYQALARILFRTDLSLVVRELGHPEAADRLNVAESYIRTPGELGVRVGDKYLEPGFAAAVGPFGVQPLRARKDLFHLEQAIDTNLSIAVASLSSRFATSLTQNPRFRDEVKPNEEWSAIRSGLTVVWLKPSENIDFTEE